MSRSNILSLFTEDIEQMWKVKLAQLESREPYIYLNGQLERCPSTNKLHLQVFVKYADNKTKKSFQSWAHCNVTAVTVEHAEAIGYGMKPDSRVDGPMEWGIKPKAVDRHKKGGESTKKYWEDIKELIITDQVDKIPFDVVMKCHLETRIGNIQKLYFKDQRLDRPAFFENSWSPTLLPYIPEPVKLRHYWIYSVLGNTGKTTHFKLPLLKKYRAVTANKPFTWWNIMGHEEIVLLDEYNTASLTYDVLNAMADGGYAYPVIHKGQISLQKHFPTIIVLCNHPIHEMYPNRPDLLRKRFIEIDTEPYRNDDYKSL